MVVCGKFHQPISVKLKCANIDVILFHQQNCTQFYQYTQLEVMLDFYAQYFTQCNRKDMHKSIEKIAHKMLLKLNPVVNFTQK